MVAAVCCAACSVHASWESTVANSSDCPRYYSAPWENEGGRGLVEDESLWAGIPEKAREDLLAQPFPSEKDPSVILFDRLQHSKCHLSWDAPPSQGKLYSFQKLMTEREEVARSRILFDFYLGDRVEATFFIVTIPSRLCLAARVVGQLESGGAQGRVVVVRGKEIDKDKCLEPFMPNTWYRPCGPRDVNSASLNEYLFPLAYMMGTDLNIFLEDDAALCASPRLLVEQSRKSPLMWLGYRYRKTLGAHMLGVWRNATPFLLALLQPFIFTPPDVYFLRGCVNPMRTAWSLGSTFPHPHLQRDTDRPADEVEKGHFENCTFSGKHSRWLPYLREREESAAHRPPPRRGVGTTRLDLMKQRQ